VINNVWRNLCDVLRGRERSRLGHPVESVTATSIHSAQSAAFLSFERSPRQVRGGRPVTATGWIRPDRRAQGFIQPGRRCPTRSLDGPV